MTLITVIITVIKILKAALSSPLFLASSCFDTKFPIAAKQANDNEHVMNSEKSVLNILSHFWIERFSQ